MTSPRRQAGTNTFENPTMSGSMQWNDAVDVLLSDFPGGDDLLIATGGDDLLPDLLVGTGVDDPSVDSRLSPAVLSGMGGDDPSVNGLLFGAGVDLKESEGLTNNGTEIIEDSNRRDMDVNAPTHQEPFPQDNGENVPQDNGENTLQDNGENAPQDDAPQPQDIPEFNGENAPQDDAPQPQDIPELIPEDNGENGPQDDAPQPQDIPELIPEDNGEIAPQDDAPQPQDDAPELIPDNEKGSRDVLLGKGLPQDHEGSNVFREHLIRHFEEYNTPDPSGSRNADNARKRRVSMQVFEDITSEGRRFLKKRRVDGNVVWHVMNSFNDELKDAIQSRFRGIRAEGN